MARVLGCPARDRLRAAAEARLPVVLAGLRRPSELGRPRVLAGACLPPAVDFPVPGDRPRCSWLSGTATPRLRAADPGRHGFGDSSPGKVLAGSGLGYLWQRVAPGRRFALEYLAAERSCWRRRLCCL